MTVCVCVCLSQVVSYHSSYYRPDNMALIVVGQVDPDMLFESLQPFEDKIIGKVLHQTISSFPSYLHLTLAFISTNLPMYALFEILCLSLTFHVHEHLVISLFL